MSPVTPPTHRLSFLLPLLLVPLLMVVRKCEGDSDSFIPDFTIQPRPQSVKDDDVRSSKVDLGSPKVDLGLSDGDERYVAYCTSKYVSMIPGNSRKFWSYGYMNLKEPYPANCTSKYVFSARVNPADSYAEYGFRIIGTFVGPNVAYSTCSETDYITIDDAQGVTATYCGTSAIIDFTTGSNYFEFTFISQENSPRALGFFVVIESFYVCGGLITPDSHGPSGFINSPRHATDYTPNTNCTWWFSGLEELTIKMDCASFLLEDVFTFPNGTTYCADYLSFSHEAISSSEETVYCNSDMDKLSRTIYSAGRNLFVNFVSDDQNHYSGFNCSYEFIRYAI